MTLPAGAVKMNCDRGVVGRGFPGVEPSVTEKLAGVLRRTWGAGGGGNRSLHQASALLLLTHGTVKQEKHGPHVVLVVGVAVWFPGFSNSYSARLSMFTYARVTLPSWYPGAVGAEHHTCHPTLGRGAVSTCGGGLPDCRTAPPMRCFHRRIWVGTEDRRRSQAMRFGETISTRHLVHNTERGKEVEIANTYSEAVVRTVKKSTCGTSVDPLTNSAPPSSALWLGAPPVDHPTKSWRFTCVVCAVVGGEFCLTSN